MARKMLYHIYAKNPIGLWKKIDDANTRRSAYDLIDKYKAEYGEDWRFEIRYGSERWEV